MRERRSQRRREGYGVLAASVVAAAALHLALLPILPALTRAAGGDGKTKGTQLVRLSRAQFDKNKRIEIKLQEAKPPTDKDEELKKKKEEQLEAPGQPVTLPPPEKEEIPDTADFASEWNQKVAHETVSRDQTPDAPAIARALEKGVAGRVQAPQGPQASQAPVEAHASGPRGPGRALTGDSGSDATDGRGERMFALEVPKQAAQEPLKLRIDVDGILKNRDAVPEIAGNGDNARIAIGNTPEDRVHRTGSGGLGRDTGQGLQGGGNGTEGLPSLAELTPSPQELAHLAGAPVNDSVPEVEVDQATMLNAWRWKHAIFFNRVADKIRHVWQGGQVLSKNDPAGSVYGFEDRLTVLQVTVDKSGNVLDLAVQEPSGALALDDEAIRACKEAGPFTNPPPVLFKGGDRFTFLFGFNVSYNRTNFDLNWRPN